MKTYVVELKSTTPVAFSRYYTQAYPRNPAETSDDHEKRTWRNKVHTDKKGNVLIPALAFKNGLTAAAKYLGEQIPGKGKSTYTKHFASGVLVQEPITLPVKKESVSGMWLHVPADGLRGGSKRVLKCFPVVEEWSGRLEVVVLDETITKDVLQTHLEQMGNFIGVGALRVQNNGIFGRFAVTSIAEKK